jgi:hypothetical protein
MTTGMDKLIPLGVLDPVLFEVEGLKVEVLQRHTKSPVSKLILPSPVSKSGASLLSRCCIDDEEDIVRGDVLVQHLTMFRGKLVR